VSRSVVWTGAVLLALGLAVFAAKVGLYGLPVTPTEALGPWQVELRVNLRGDGRRGSLRVLLPASDRGQRIFDERSASDRLSFSIRESGGDRVGVWSGWLEGVHEVVYGFRVQSRALPVALPPDADAEVPAALRGRYTPATSDFPAAAPEVRGLLDTLGVPGPEDPDARIRALYAFVTHEIATVPSAGRDALLTLAQREGSPEGKERLLVSLLRAAEIPARLARGLELREGTAPEERVWTEAWLGGVWVPMSTCHDFFEQRPEGYVALGTGEPPMLEATGVRAVGHRWRSLREHLRPDEVATLLEPENRTLAWLSLYRLPVATQSTLRVLLLMPLGALLVALFRNGIGVVTFGTFMPILIALALRGFALAEGLALVAFVILIGVASRLALDRLRLLMVPRLSILLCLVVLSVTVLALLGRETGNREFFAGVVFPIVILTMLIERVSITIAEEGMRPALVRAGWSVLVAMGIWPVFRSARAEHLMFTFPELAVAVIGALVWIGGYTGYRVSDLLRFRAFAQPAGEEAP
jgi:hypothetical protein